MPRRADLPPVAARRSALEARFRPWAPMTLAQAFDCAADAHPDRPLVITDDVVLTYRDVQEQSRRLAAGLVALGVGAGAHVALVMANHPEFVPLKFALARAGAVCVPINYLFRSAELGYVLDQSDASLLVTMDRFRDLDYLAALDGLAPGWESGWENDSGGGAIPALHRVVVFSAAGEHRPGTTTLADLAAAGTAATRVELAAREAAADPAAHSDVLYTSGTTGHPKGVLLTHDQIVRMAYASAYQRALEDGRRMAFPMPMYHVFGYVECLMASLFVGGAVVPQVVFDAAGMLTAIARHGVHEVVAVPAVTLPLLAEFRRGAYDVGSVHTVFSSGGVAPQSIWSDLRAVFGDVELTTGYGMTETTAATTCTDPDGPDERLWTSNGRLRAAGAAGDDALGGHLAVYRVVDPATGDEVPPGLQGHLLARGPAVTRGYYRKPAETAAAFTADGWLCSGDLGTVDTEGYLTLTGRLKETFRVGGEMVMPREVELALIEHPTVADAHVVGVPHERWGEVACAFVVPADPAAGWDAAELVAHCAARLARFKVPRHVLEIDPATLPLTATGRVQKFRLAATARDRLAAPDGPPGAGPAGPR